MLGPDEVDGEVMGVADNFGEAFAKAQTAAGQKLPIQGTVSISVTDHDKPNVTEVARKSWTWIFKLVAICRYRQRAEVRGMTAWSACYKVKRDGLTWSI